MADFGIGDHSETDTRELIEELVLQGCNNGMENLVMIAKGKLVVQSSVVQVRNFSLSAGW